MRAFCLSTLATLALCLLVDSDVGAQDLLVVRSRPIGMALHQPAARVATASRTIAADEVTRDTRGNSTESRPPSSAIGPTIEGASVGARSITLSPLSRPVVAGVQQRPRVGQSKALMIVGGVALVAGLIIGDDAGAVLAVGGAVVGLYGLYQYVR